MEYALYALGLVLVIGAATETVLAGWAALAAGLVGLAIFCLGIVVEEWRIKAKPRL